MSSNEIKVDKKIKSLPVNERKLISFNIGARYYVSFGGNVAKICRLLEHNPITKQITIEQEHPTEFKTKRGILLTTKNYLFEDEIGDTPEHAVQNAVTS